MRTKPISQNKWIGYFRVSPAQASVPNEVLSAQPLIWKWFSILMQIKQRLCTLPYFETEGFWNLEVAYFIYETI